MKFLIDAYFDDCRDRQRPTTIAGLAVALKVDRQTIYNYRDRDEFFGLIKEARDRILANLEEEMMIKGTAGQIFLAKNYGLCRTVSRWKLTKLSTDHTRV